LGRESIAACKAESNSGRLLDEGLLRPTGTGSGCVEVVGSIGIVGVLVDVGLGGEVETIAIGGGGWTWIGGGFFLALSGSALSLFFFFVFPREPLDFLLSFFLSSLLCGGCGDGWSRVTSTRLFLNLNLFLNKDRLLCTTSFDVWLDSVVVDFCWVGLVGSGML